jgi:hypothetical protein
VFEAATIVSRATMIVMLRLTFVALVGCGGGGSSTGDGGGGGDAPEVLDVCPATQGTPLTIRSGFQTDGVDFYFHDAGALHRQPLAGGAAVELVDVASINGPPALGDQHVFYLDGTQAMRVAKTGGTPDMLGTVADPMRLATDGTAAYVSSFINPDIQIWRANGSATLVTTVPAVDGFADLSSDGMHIYWSAATGGVTARIRRIPVGGGTVEDFSDATTDVTANIRITGLAFAGREVVWAAGYQSFSDGRVFAMPTESGTRRELSRTGYPEELSVFDQTVYAGINGPGGNRIVAIPLAGGARTVVGCLPDRISELVATSAGVIVSSGSQVLLFPR